MSDVDPIRELEELRSLTAGNRDEIRNHVAAASMREPFWV